VYAILCVSPHTDTHWWGTRRPRGAILLNVVAAAVRRRAAFYFFDIAVRPRTIAGETGQLTSHIRTRFVYNIICVSIVCAHRRRVFTCHCLTRTRPVGAAFLYKCNIHRELIGVESKVVFCRHKNVLARYVKTYTWPMRGSMVADAMVTCEYTPRKITFENIFQIGIRISSEKIIHNLLIIVCFNNCTYTIIYQTFRSELIWYTPNQM